MKILYISMDDSIYGANRAMLNLIDELNIHGCECEVLLSRKGIVERELKSRNIKYYIFKFCPWLVKNNETTIKNVLRKIYNKFAFYFISQKLKAQNYDIIHTNSSVTNLGVYLAKSWKCKHVWHIREDISVCQLKYIYRDSIVRRNYLKSDEIVTISRYIKYIQDEYLKTVRCKVVYDGIPIKHFNPPLKSRNENPVICVVGIIHPSKRQYEVCQAIKRLVDEGYSEVLCYVIGGIGDILYYRKIKEYINNNNLKKNIIFVGHIMHPDKYYQICDFGIMSSSGEGFGLVTIEFMVYYVMVIGSNAGATPEIIHNGKNGILYRSGDVDDLSSKIKWCIDHKTKCMDLAIQGNKDVQMKFSIQKHGKQIMWIYNNLLKNEV